MGGGGAPEPPGPPGAAAAACEQDRFLPIANISRIMKKALPGNAKIAKDAKVRPAPPPRRAGAVRLPPRLARTVPLPLLHLPSSGWRPDSAPLRSAPLRRRCRPALAAEPGRARGGLHGVLRGAAVPPYHYISSSAAQVPFPLSSRRTSVASTRPPSGRTPGHSSGSSRSS